MIDVVADEIVSQVESLAKTVEQIGDLVASARRLAERQPKLGTAPPAMHLATRLRDAAGQTGLAGEVTAADSELDSFHRALRTTVSRYQEGDKDAALTVTRSGEAPDDRR
ncbi:hypothetical protein AOZ06_18440 [Kibdelosporangium phytohabitans]|uniref:PE domain-containing protein n=1 Tax=Kibdelosporangium phytohabitans TaxID=860235 RepID=A0A0N9IHM2_9PSEU|nr:hypothetical protein [Kibdelosporangium phytohabitans]ALG14873.1 hypothetical protein AOZ06_18440 [Kibdelosporangium phytohabitans]